MLTLFTNIQQNLTPATLCVRCFWDISEALDIEATDQDIHQVFQREGWFSCQNLGTWGCTDKNSTEIFKAEEDN